MNKGSEKKADNVMKKIKLIGMNVEIILSSRISSLIIEGPEGIGKTFNVLRSLGKLGLKPYKDYVYFNGHSTPLSFYTTLFENKSKNVIVLDDIDTLFINGVGKQLFKGALDNVTGIRVLRWSSSRRPKCLPESFVFDAKLIIVANKLPTDADFKAVRDRGIYLYYDLTYEERLCLFKKLIENNSLIDGMALSKKEKRECFNFLQSETNEFCKPTIRDLEKIFVIYNNCKKRNSLHEFKDLGRAILKRGRGYKLVVETGDSDEKRRSHLCVLRQKRRKM